MASLNTNKKTAGSTITTHEGGPAQPTSPINQLRRSVASCFLWEDGFYEDGISIGQRISDLAAKCSYQQVVNLAIECRTKHNLRHVPLLLLASLTRREERTGAANTTPLWAALEQVIQRPDEISEFLSIYWTLNSANGKKGPISAQVRRGLGEAFRKFNAYSLGKYKGNKKNIALRDVIRLVRPTPLNAEQSNLWKQLVTNPIPIPNTWETRLSAGEDKRAVFTELLQEGQLGYLALLRNLRNMEESKVDDKLVAKALIARKNGAEKVLPFRFIAAWRATTNGRIHTALEKSLRDTMDTMASLKGRTAVLVDVSGSMGALLSRNSDMTRMDAACALAMLCRGDVDVFSFSDKTVEVPRCGDPFQMVEAIKKSQPNSSTYLGEAVEHLNRLDRYDRYIVITDEQSADSVPDPKAKNSYMINVATDKHGVGYRKWVHLDGFSEGVLRWITEYETFNA